MMVFKISAILSCLLASTYSAIAPGQNAYLPPKQNGYNYDKPSQPFPTQPPLRPSPSPFQPQRPTYGPPPPGKTPSPGFPTRPPTGPFPTRPPTGPATRPTYGPPQGPQGPPATGPNYVGQPSSPTGQQDHVHVPGMPFDFNYAVKDDEYGNDYSHNAVSDGDVTRGEYRIQLPDGRTQIVKYTADWKTGYHAQVSFEGNPTYPTFQGRPSNQVPTNYPSGPSRPSGPAPGFPSGPAPGYPSGPAPGYPSGPSRPSGPSPGYPSGPSRPTPSFPSGPRPTQPGYPSGPSRPTPSFPSGPSRPSQPGYPSGPRPTPSFPSPPRPTSRPNQIPGQQYTPNGGYKY